MADFGDEAGKVVLDNITRMARMPFDEMVRIMLRKMLNGSKNFEPQYNKEGFLELGVSPEQAPDKPTYVTIHFEKGIPTMVDGEALGYSPFEFEVIDRAVRVVVSEKFMREEAARLQAVSAAGTETSLQTGNTPTVRS